MKKPELAVKKVIDSYEAAVLNPIVKLPIDAEQKERLLVVAYDLHAKLREVYQEVGNCE